MKNRLWEKEVPSEPFKQARSWIIVASAGCGKTYTIEKCINELLLGGVKPTEIMYILFNRRPAEEFKAKFRQKGLEDDEMKWWGTHHSIARRLLHLPVDKILRGKKLIDWGKLKGFDFNPRREDADAIVDDHTATTWDETLHSLDVKLYDGETAYDAQETRLLDALQKSEVEDGMYTDTRYLLKTLHMRLMPVGIKYVFVDEGQDNGKAQFEYFSWLLQQEQIQGFMMAGDDKQAINRFKGGRSSLFLNFEAQRYVCLPKTWRCPPAILKEMNAVVKPIKERSPITEESALGDVKGNVEWADEFEDCLYDLEKYTKEKKTILVLSRNRCFLQEAYYSMRRHGIPMKLNWLERMREVMNGLKTLRMDGRLTKGTLNAILPSDRGTKGELLRKPYFERGAVERLRKGEFGDDWDKAAAYDKILAEGLEMAKLPILGFTERFIESITGGEKIHFPADTWNVEPNDADYFKQIVKKMGLEWSKVELATIHTAKGGEADVVVLIRNITKAVHDEETNEDTEERRVWYVGISRAKEKVFFTRLLWKKTDLTTELV